MKKIPFFLLLSTNVLAAPSGGDLLKACQTSLENGFQGPTGMMCVWYVSPCDCHQGKDVAIPRVCLPEDKDAEELARIVIDGLLAEPELQFNSAEVVAAEILAAIYPCDPLNFVE